MAGTYAFAVPRPATCKKEVDKITANPAPLPSSENPISASPPTVTSSAVEASPKPPPPDGDREAWLVVLGATVSAVHTWGLVNSFGVFETYYERELFAATAADNHPHVSSSAAISWIGSVQGALLMMGGVVSGPLFDMGHLRLLLLAGHGLVVLGMFLTSVCTQYYQLLLAQGVCVGLGCGLLYLPSAAAVGQWFEKRRALAMGMQSVGSPIAGIVLPIIFSKLQPLVGFSWATRIIAFILLGLSTVPLVFLKARVGPYPSRKRRALLGLWVPFFYVQLYAIGFGASSVAFSPYFVTLFNIGSAVGRILPPWAALYTGSLHTILGMTTMCAATGFLWLGIADNNNLSGLVVFVVLYGVFQGGLVSMLPSSIVPLTPDMGQLGTRMGTNYLFSGLSILAGTPVAGAILGKGGDDADWKGFIAYAGATLAAGSVLMVAALVLHRRGKRL